VSRSGEEPPQPRRRALNSASRVFVEVFALFSPNPATPRAEALARTRRHALILGLALGFIVLSLLTSTALVVYTAWTHDVENGALAIAFAVVCARVAVNWSLWRAERDAEETARNAGRQSPEDVSP
jgi:hypothetical protein